MAFLASACRTPDAGDPAEVAPSATHWRPPAESMEKIGLRWQTRDAMGASDFTWRIEAEPGAALVFATAVTCEKSASGEKVPCLDAWRFDIEADSESIFRHVEPPETFWRWRRHRIDLDDAAGRPVTLRFRATRLGDGTDTSRVLWSRPFVARPSKAPNLLLISIDTLRADRLGSHGYAVTPPITPALDALATGGARFAEAISQAPWTTPSHMSMFTGQYPSRHGVNQSFSRFAERFTAPYRGLRAETPTLASVLSDRGYRTIAATGGATIGGVFGFSQGFDIYQEAALLRDAAAVRWVRDRLEGIGEAPFFVFLHTFSPHAPYEVSTYADRAMSEEAQAAHDAFMAVQRADPVTGHRHNLIQAQRRYLQEAGLFTPEVASALYDGGVRRADAIVGAALDMLDALGVAENTLVIVTSDHGEEFGEHDPDRFYDAHCTTLFDELLHVPLIMRFPGRIDPGTVIDRQVRLIDLMPTALSLLDVPVPETVQGESLVPLIEDPEMPWRRWSLSEATCSGPEQKAMRTESMKYVAAYSADVERSGIPGELLWQRLFRLDDDPGEQSSVHHRPESKVDALRRSLETRLHALESPPGAGRDVDVDDSMREALKALGYID